MRIYSNTNLTVMERIHLWKTTRYPLNNPFGWNRNDMIFKVGSAHKGEISFIGTNMYTRPPVGFITQFVWEYPDKQIGVCSLDLKKYDMFRFGKLYQQSIQLPEDVKEGDLVYVDKSKIT